LKTIPVLTLTKPKLFSLGNNLRCKMHSKQKPVTGYRIVNVEALKQNVLDITMHACLCEKAKELAIKDCPVITLKGDKCKSGLFSILTLQCHAHDGCKKEFNLATSEKNISTNIYIL